MLFGFGDSFTQGCCDGGYVETPFLDIIGKKLDTQVKNCARWGMSFEDIMATITKHLTVIKKGDVVILGGTTVDRMMFPVPYEQVISYHGINSSKANMSVTGIGYNTLNWFFDSKAWNSSDTEVWNDNHQDFGYQDKESYIKLYFDQWNKLKRPFGHAFEGFFYDWVNHWESYFTGIGVRFYYWHHNWWNFVPEDKLCDCKHWTNEGHEQFAEIMWEVMLDNDNGELKLPNTVL